MEEDKVGRKRDRSGDQLESELEGAVGTSVPMSLVSIPSLQSSTTSLPGSSATVIPPKEAKVPEKKRKADPDIILAAPNTLNFAELTTSDIYKELVSGRINKVFLPE